MDDENVVPISSHIERMTEEMKGPALTGHQICIEGRSIPKMTMRERGGMIELTLDGRLSTDFPREWAYLAAAFAANAMAIGAGFGYLGSDEKIQAFAPKVFRMDTPPNG